MKMLICLILLTLSGCATDDYALRVNAQVLIDTAKYKADEAKWTSMGTIAVAGGEGSKVAALIGMSKDTGSSTPSSRLPDPVTISSEIRAWVNTLLDRATPLVGIYKNAQVQIRASDNATALGISTNQAFVGMAGKIQAPAPNITIGGNGVIGDGSYKDQHDNNSVNGSYNPDQSQHNPVDDHSNHDNPISNPIVGTP